MSASALTTKDYEHVDQLVKEGKTKEVMNWIIAHEALDQAILLEYFHKVR